MNTRKRTAIGILAALVIGLSGLLAGCAMGNRSIGNESMETLRQKLVPGRSTKADVISQLGEPNVKGTTGAGQQYWAYTLSSIGSVKIITFFFTANDVVDNFTFSGSRD